MTEEKRTQREAVESAVDDCIQNNILKDFLINNRAEVVDAFVSEYATQAKMELCFERGYRAGFEKTYSENLINVVKKLHLSLDEATRILEIPIFDVADYF